MTLNLSLSSTPKLNTQNPKLSSHHHHSLSSFVHSNTSVSPPKTHYKNLSLKCRHSDFYDPAFSNSYIFINRFSSNDSSFSPQPVTSSPRVFVGHSIYKGKSALTVEPRLPEFSPLDSGAFKLSKEGYVLLQFAPAAGVRQYDWSRKQVFSLSVTEMGSLISLGARDSCEFFHDPFKGRSDEGKVRKVLKIEPLPDGSGHFFNLSVQNKLINVDENIYIPITKAEYAILISAFNFIVPYLLGWHTFANSIKPEDRSRTNIANPRSGGDFEWSR